MLLHHRGAVFLRNYCRLRLCQSWKSSVRPVVVLSDFLRSSEAGFGCGLWVTESWQYRTFTLWRQKAAGRLPCSQGPLSSNLPGGALEVCHAEVGGRRGSDSACERASGGRMFVCCVCVAVKQLDARVGFCCVTRLKCEHPLLVPVCFGSRPSTFCSAPPRPVHHRLEEVTR